MTLNLMLTSKAAVYLSADFRLVSLEDQTPLPDSYDTQKLIPVIRHGWTALVAYMGIASAPPVIADMGQWIGDQTDAIPPDGNWSELSTRLLHLNGALGRLRGDRRIAFSVVWFRDRQPWMMLISNFINLDGAITPAAPQLTAYLRTPHRPEVRFVGTVRPDIFDRVRLVRMLQANATRGVVPQLIREAVAGINADVARRSDGSISEACVSGYLLESGAAAIGGHGIPADAPCFPGWVRRDLARAGVVGFESPDRGDATSPMQWMGTTARVVRGRLQRVHEIANAGVPLLADRDHPGPRPTWTPGVRGAKHAVRITLAVSPSGASDHNV